MGCTNSKTISAVDAPTERAAPVKPVLSSPASSPTAASKQLPAKPILDVKPQNLEGGVNQPSLRLTVGSPVQPNSSANGNGTPSAGSQTPLPFGNAGALSRAKSVDPRALAELPPAAFLAAALNDSAYFTNICASVCNKTHLSEAPDPAKVQPPKATCTTEPQNGAAAHVERESVECGACDNTSPQVSEDSLNPVSQACSAELNAAVSASATDVPHAAPLPFDAVTYQRMLETICFSKDDKLSHGNDVIEIAAAAGSADVLEVLLKALSSLVNHVKASTGNTLLHYAALGPRTNQPIYDTLIQHLLHDHDISGDTASPVPGGSGRVSAAGATPTGARTPVLSTPNSAGKKKSTGVQYVQQLVHLTKPAGNDDDDGIIMAPRSTTGSFFGTGLGLGSTPNAPNATAPVSAGAPPLHPSTPTTAVRESAPSNKMSSLDLEKLAAQHRLRHLHKDGGGAMPEAQKPSNTPPVTRAVDLTDITARFPPRSIERTVQVLLKHGAPRSKKNLFGKVPRDIALANASQIIPEAAVSMMSGGTGSGTALLAEGTLFERLLHNIPVDWDAVTDLLFDPTTMPKVTMLGSGPQK